MLVFRLSLIFIIIRKRHKVFVTSLEFFLKSLQLHCIVTDLTVSRDLIESYMIVIQPNIFPE